MALAMTQKHSGILMISKQIKWQPPFLAEKWGKPCLQGSTAGYLKKLQIVGNLVGVLLQNCFSVSQLQLSSAIAQLIELKRYYSTVQLYLWSNVNKCFASSKKRVTSSSLWKNSFCTKTKNCPAHHSLTCRICFYGPGKTWQHGLIK